jgi:hypothetical protein
MRSFDAMSVCYRIHNRAACQRPFMLHLGFVCKLRLKIPPTPSTFTLEFAPRRTSDPITRAKRVPAPAVCQSDLPSASPRPRRPSVLAPRGSPESEPPAKSGASSFCPAPRAPSVDGRPCALFLGCASLLAMAGRTRTVDCDGGCSVALRRRVVALSLLLPYGAYS